MPKQTKLSISYSAGVKAQIVKYELSSDVHASRSEEWDVSDFTPEQVDLFYAERYAALNQQMSQLIEQEYAEMTGQ